MREVLALNVARLLEHHFREVPNRPKRLAIEAGVSLSTVQRILGKETGATIDNIEAVAGVFHLSAYQLLLPSLDVRNPQVVKGATKDEERLYRLWKQDKLSTIGQKTSEKTESTATKAKVTT